MRILWLGPLSDKTRKGNSTLSPAADNWQRGLISGLNENCVEVEVLSFQPNPLFPKGNLMFNSNKSEANVRQVGYFNFPGIRELSLIQNFKKQLKKEGEYDAVITYNCLPHHVAGGKWLKSHGVPWISIIADDEYVNGADLFVFLSYGYYQKARVQPKMHIDGGVEEFVDSGIKIPEKKILHFSGSLNKWTGILDFTYRFSKLDLPDVELHIYGKGETERLNQISSQNSNIVVKGFVTKEELDNARREAFAFVNPRPTDIEGGEFNFPSKILEYLKYGKPIISTKTEGVAPDYSKFLEFYDPNSFQSMTDTLSKVLSLTTSDLIEIKKKIRKYTKNHSWKAQATKLIKHIPAG